MDKALRKPMEYHGMSHSRLYRIWRGMIYRCYDAKSKSYKDYGGRGITICEEWKMFIPFMEWSFSHGYSEELSIDRIDVNGNYDPSNCRWATSKVQMRNRRDTIRIPDGTPLQEICEKTGINYSLVLSRIEMGWSWERALTETPTLHRKSHRRVDIVGKRFGKWTVVSDGFVLKGRHMFLCKCDCGTFRFVDGVNLRKGKTKSCGCRQNHKRYASDYATTKDVPEDFRRRGVDYAAVWVKQ